MAGFADASHLTRTFRRTFGKTPRDMVDCAGTTGVLGLESITINEGFKTATGSILTTGESHFKKVEGWCPDGYQSARAPSASPALAAPARAAYQQRRARL